MSFSPSISFYKGRSGIELNERKDISCPYVLCSLLRDKPTSVLPTYPLLGPQRSQDEGKKTLVLDLDETLVHSSFNPGYHDFTVTVSMEGRKVPVYVSERPGVRDFLEQMRPLFELVVFTASSSDVVVNVVSHV